jgi:arylsulfatase A-like enzyme
VEFVDIYPTLCSLAKVTQPSTLQGKSLVNVMKGTDKAWKNIAISEWRGARTITTTDYSYSLWIDQNAKETHLLFDHKSDLKENENIADKPENNKIINKLKDSILTFYNQIVK